MRFQRAILAILTLLLTRGSPEAQAGMISDVIYDNTTTRKGSGLSFTALQIGSEVNAAGTDRLVTDLFIGVSQQGLAGTANLQARLYANDGAGGKPGSLLWNGPLLSNVPLTGGLDLIDFAVPQVLVPDTFTWTVQISNSSPVAAGLPSFGPPTIGTSSTNWFGDGSVWDQLPGDPFEARVDAVPAAALPEPSSALLLLSGTGGWIVRCCARLGGRGRSCCPWRVD